MKSCVWFISENIKYKDYYDMDIDDNDDVKCENGNRWNNIRNDDKWSSIDKMNIYIFVVYVSRKKK